MLWPLTWKFSEIIQEESVNPLCVALISTAMWIQCLKSFDDLCLTRLSFTAGEPIQKTLIVAGDTSMTTIPGPIISQPWLSHSSEAVDRLSFGLSILWNMRGVGTRAEITQIPPWSRKNKFFLPSRSQETRRHVENIGLSFLVLAFFATRGTRNVDNFMSPNQEKLLTRLDEISLAEGVFRFAASFSFWLNLFCIIQAVNSFFGILYVGLGLYPVKMVPPMWGKLSDAVSIRKFWGNVWHQTLRRLLVSWSEFVIHDLLQMPKVSLIARYCKLAFCFFISGLLHLSADLALGVPVGQSNAISFFLATALLIMFEDAMQYLYRRVKKNDRSRWPRYLGYCWMSCYIFWLTPSWSYPGARAVQSDNYLGDLSLVGFLSVIRHIT